MTEVVKQSWSTAPGDSENMQAATAALRVYNVEVAWDKCFHFIL